MKNVRNPKSILYVHYGDNWIRGSEIVLLDLLNMAIENHYQPILWCNSEMLAEQAKKLGVEVIVDDFICLGYWTNPRWRFFQFFRQIFKATRLIKKFNVSLVHCNNGAPCQWLAIACKWVKTPLLLHLHARYHYRDRLTLLFHGADKVVGVSKSVIDMFNVDEFKHQHSEVIYNGINPQRVLSSCPIDLRVKVNASDNDFVLLFIGSLISRKSVDSVIRAIANLRNKNAIKFAIYGDGSEKNRLVTLCKNLKLDNIVYFFPETADVAKIYSSNADCFISTPVEEVFGLTLAEASIAKLPVITCDVPGVNEIFTSNDNAILIPAKNLTALEQAIEQVIMKPELTDKMVENAHHHITKNFNCQKQFYQFEYLYQQLQNNNMTQDLFVSAFAQISRVLAAIRSKVLTKVVSKLPLSLRWKQGHE